VYALIKTDRPPADVRFTPDSGFSTVVAAFPRSANGVVLDCSKAADRPAINVNLLT
jgi:hypothetical protein